MKKKLAGHNCGNCRKRRERTCNVYKTEGKRPPDDEWCGGWSGKKEGK